MFSLTLIRKKGTIKQARSFKMENTVEKLTKSVPEFARSQLHDFHMELKLCKKSANANAMLRDMWRSLWTFCWTKYPAVLSVAADDLLKAGVDVRTPIKNGDEALARLPEMFERSGDSFKRIDRYFCRTLKRLYQAGADINAPINGKGNILHRLGYTVIGEKCVELALALGANPNARDATDKTPIFYMTGPQKVKLLYDAGADVNAKDNAGVSVLAHHLRTSYIDKTESIKFLIEKGADLSATDKSGKNIMWYAWEYCNPQEIEMIEKAVKAKANQQKIMQAKSDRTY